MEKSALYGIIAEFNDPETLLAATRRARDAGYRKMDAYTPVPIEGLAETLGVRGTRLPYIVLAGGILGGLSGYLLQYWVAVIDYPLNVGGRPYHSWISFIPVTFEGTVLIAALAAVLGMLALNGLPQPYHPVFNVPRFELASRDRFFLAIEAEDLKFDVEETRRFLESVGPTEVTEIERYKYPA
jgi:hypothetical protein